MAEKEEEYKMTRGIEDMLNIPHLDEILKEDGVDFDPEDKDENLPAQREQIDVLDSMIAKIQNAEGTDHGKAMDELASETLDHSRSIVDLAFNVDDKARRGLLEQAANFYKVSLDAKNSKRDAQLKAWKLMQDQQKLDLEERKFRASKGEPEEGAVTAEATVLEDRNELIRKMRDQIKAEKDTK